MEIFITFITITHALLFLTDEHVFHKKRGLGQKEINHGVFDGLLFMGVVALTIFTTYSSTLGIIYISLGALSCLSILTNEFFYPDKLERYERLIHGLLYIFHPLILFSFYVSWKEDFFNLNMTYWMLQLGYLVLIFKGLAFHIIYWNYINEKK